MSTPQPPTALLPARPPDGTRPACRLLVGIGASAGGLEALGKFLGNVPAQTGLAFVVVQHLDPHHPSLRVDILGGPSSLPVLEAADGVRPQPDHVYIIPRGVLLFVRGGVFRLETADRPTLLAPIDRFFRSLAEDFREQAVGIVLSGSGHDGTAGLRAIKEYGGLTLAQAPDTAKPDSMPRIALDAGLVDHALPPEELPKKLLEHAGYVDALERDGGAVAGLESANEELQTSKQGLPSLNEELETVNAELRQKLEALSAANNDLQSLFAATSVATIFLDREMHISKFTPAATSLFGLVEGDVGRPLGDFSPRFVADDVMEKAREVLRTLREVEQEVPTRDGSAWFNLRIQPYRTIESSIAGVVITFVDVTAQKRTESELRQALAEAEQGRRLLDAVMENVPEGITIADAPDVRIRMVSRYGRELTGKARHLLEGITVEEHAQRWQIYAADQTTLADNEDLPLTRATKHGEVIRNEEWVLGHSDGTRVPVLCNAGPIRDEAGAIVGGVITWRDITELKRGEEALRLANEQLEEVNLRKNHFLAVLSHELRNPLAPIKNSLHILDQAVLEGEQARRARLVINRQVNQLARLVDDLLDVTRITQDKVKLQRQRLELNELVRRTVEDHRPGFTEAQVRVEVELAAAPVFVHADGHRLAQVIGNLLQNAAKFTAPGGCVTVSVSSEPAAGRAAIRVADTGLGMAPEMLSRLFQPFMQADTSLDRGRGGLGLGLSLVKGLVELHGGQVEARSAGLGKGSEFMVYLPLELDGGRAPSQERVAAAAPPRRVLIIEDNPDAADSLRAVLELAEHEVAVAYNGPEGIAKARAFRPEVVLCDVGLPGMSGYEVARAFRADALLKEVHLVALSGYALPEDLKRAAEAGFEQHLAKPPDLDALTEVLAGLLAK